MPTLPHSVHTKYLRAPYNSYHKRRLYPYTALCSLWDTDWICIYHTTQINFCLKRLAATLSPCLRKVHPSPSDSTQLCCPQIIAAMSFSPQRVQKWRSSGSWRLVIQWQVPTFRVTCFRPQHSKVSRLLKNAGSRSLRNVGAYLPNYVASQTRKLKFL
jgi:hypothetical protein